MARSRNIKPGFFTNDTLAELAPLARLLFVGMWTIADRAGRLEDRPKRIKAEVLPYDDCDVDAMLTGLERAGFILRYESAGVRAIQVVNWDKHQNPHMKESESTIPAPCEHQTSTVQAPKQEQPEPERAGLIPDSLNLIPDSLKGKPRKRDAAPPTARPDDVDEKTWGDWQQLRKSKRAPVTDTVLDGARAEAAKAGITLQRFLEIWCMRGSQGLQADWLRADERGKRQPAEPAWRTEQRERTQQAAPGVAAGMPAAEFFIDVAARDVTTPALTGVPQ